MLFGHQRRLERGQEHGTITLGLGMNTIGHQLVEARRILRHELQPVRIVIHKEEVPLLGHVTVNLKVLLLIF